MRTPFTILTGWLGAGKTSALNRVLTAPGGAKIAVLVNELGRISIDTKLIVGGGGDVLELAGGCVCCKVDINNDLWEGIADVVARSRPDHVVLETTGIAEPRAILDSLIATSPIAGEIASKRTAEQAAARDCIVPAGVVCVVDADTGAEALDTRDEAAAQAAAADRILISKLDIADADCVRRTHARLDVHASHAERASFPTTDAGSRELTRWVLERRPIRSRDDSGEAITPAVPPVPRRGFPRVIGDFQGSPGCAPRQGFPRVTALPTRECGVGSTSGHRHGTQLTALSFSDDVPLVADRVLAVVESLGARLVRAKGFVDVAGDHRRGFIERAGGRTALTLGQPWGDAPRRSEVVLIGDDLDEPALRRALWACRAGR